MPAPTIATCVPFARIRPEATHYARAAEISRKTFGDYADISVSGDGLRKYFIPFYSWMEVNFRYHANLFRNLGDMGAGAGAAQLPAARPPRPRASS